MTEYKCFACVSLCTEITSYCIHLKYINSQISENIHPNSLTLDSLLDKARLYAGDCHVSVPNNYDKLVMLFGVIR